MTTDQLLAAAKGHHQAGRGADAERLYRQALAQSPTQTEALVLLGSLLLGSGRIVEATTLFREDVRRKPNDVGAHLALASLLQAQGAVDEAMQYFQRVLQWSPTHGVACSRLGHIERSRRNFGAAIGWFGRVVAGAPASGEARNDLGNALVDAGRADEAVVQLREAARLDPGRAEVHYNLGIALVALGRFDEAVVAYRRAVELNPAFAEAWNNLGGALKALTRLDEAVAAFDQVLRVKPDAVGALSNLAGVLEWQARHDDALACHRRAMAIAPDSAGVHGNYLFTLLFHPAFGAQALRAEHDAWEARHAQPLGAALCPHDVDPTPGRPLRIGYVCGLLRDHVLGRYLMPLLREHDRAAFEVICYSNNRTDDAITDRFRRVVSGWRDIGALSDDETAALIRHDGIDILVDTSVHMDGNRLLVFARRPAPIQVTFAGYPGSTGMRAVDYRLTDVHLDPPGLHDTHYAERSVRLPDTFWCYDPLAEDATPGPLPAEAAGHVTFGCLNNFSKVNDPMLALWAAVLRAVPSARLLLLAHEGSHRARTLAVFAGLGIDAARVSFVGYRPRSSYLALFRRIDITLDTVPYNGHTTSLDSLWMGVPVVTLVGETVVGRAGLSQLMNLGLPELIARTTSDYVTIAAALAGDPTRLSGLRQTLRERMERSPLMDATAFARHIEAAYRTLWAQRISAATPRP